MITRIGINSQCKTAVIPRRMSKGKAGNRCSICTERSHSISIQEKQLIFNPLDPNPLDFIPLDNDLDPTICFNKISASSTGTAPPVKGSPLTWQILLMKVPPTPQEQNFRRFNAGLSGELGQSIAQVLHVDLVGSKPFNCS